MNRHSQAPDFISKEILFPSEIKRLAILETFLSEVFSADENVFSNIITCLNEALSNAIIHGNKENISKFVRLDVASINQKLILFKITDEGEGFNPTKIPNPIETDNLEKIGGRGVYIMRKLADFCIFNNLGNEVTLYFKF